MGFLTNLGLAAGRNILYGQEFQEKQAELDLRKQQVAMGQMAMQQAQRQQQTQQAVGSFLASEAAKDQSNVTDPVKAAQDYQKAAAIALQNGDFTSANTMGELAKGKLNEAKEQSAVLAQQQQKKKEDLAETAEGYAANPTPEAARSLMQKAVDAGVPPSQIPMPGTPQWGSWVNQQTLASKTAAQQADFKQKAYEMDANRQEKQREFKERELDRQAQRQQTALLRESAAEDRKMRLDMERERLDMAKEKAAAGPKQSANQIAANNAIVASASEGLRGLKNIGAMSSDATAGPFAGLHDGTILDTIAKTGSQILTPTDMQIYHVAAAGMGLEVARTLTLGGGRGANQSLINEMQSIVEVKPGESKATALFKFSNAADIIRNRLSTLPDTPDPKVAAQRKELEADLDKIPTPQQVLASVKTQKERDHLLGIQGSMADLAGQVAGSTQLPGGADAGAGSNAPPIPANIQSLVDKYRSK